MLHPAIPITGRDFEHGTAVTSIFVDGPAFNPDLEDGCGKFKVKQCSVANNSSFISFTILRNISEIVAQNRDIKVWNLSLGSKLSIHPNFISPEAAILDKIQYENDVIFVIVITRGMPRSIEGVASAASYVYMRPVCSRTSDAQDFACDPSQITKRRWSRQIQGIGRKIYRW